MSDQLTDDLKAEAAKFYSEIEKQTGFLLSVAKRSDTKEVIRIANEIIGIAGRYKFP